tara:strand:+ start:66 stop:311 length:246 start_codon:yes stop_codon:yes gene_type:complete
MLRIKMNNGDPAELDTPHATEDEMKILNAKAQRNSLLADSDKYMISDFPVKNKSDWETYRELLRDMDFSDPDNITFPTKPE